jgi:hypothetical protein
LSLQSFALPAEMRARLTLSGDHIECRCGLQFAPEAGFIEVRDHARQCFGKRQVRHLHEQEPTAAVSEREIDIAADIAAMKRLQAEADRAERIRRWARSWGKRRERTGLV